MPEVNSGGIKVLLRKTLGTPGSRRRHRTCIFLSEDGEFQIGGHKAEHVRMIFAYYLSGASLGKVVELLCPKRIASPTGNANWTRAAIGKLLSSRKYIPLVGLDIYMDVPYKKGARRNVGHDRADAPRKAVRYTWASSRSQGRAMI